jgi:hypothetical protein
MGVFAIRKLELDSGAATTLFPESPESASIQDKKLERGAGGAAGVLIVIDLMCAAPGVKPLVVCGRSAHEIAKKIESFIG